MRLGRRDVGNVEKTGQTTYQGSICHRAHAILEFSVEEITKALVLRQVLDFNLFQVATKGSCVESETDGPEPNRQFKRVDVSP